MLMLSMEIFIMVGLRDAPTHQEAQYQGGLHDATTLQEVQDQGGLHDAHKKIRTKIIQSHAKSTNPKQLLWRIINIVTKMNYNSNQINKIRTIIIKIHTNYTNHNSKLPKSTNALSKPRTNINENPRQIVKHMIQIRIFQTRKSTSP